MLKYNGQHVNDPILIWEMIKGVMRGQAISYDSTMIMGRDKYQKAYNKYKQAYSVFKKETKADV